LFYLTPHGLTPTNGTLKLLIASVTLLHHPASNYLDLRTGELFGEGGVEKEFHALPVPIQDSPPAIPHATGGVIMSKLGNATAK
jgi:FAD-linked sulfhydryl oxidase